MNDLLVSVFVFKYQLVDIFKMLELIKYDSKIGS